jgi:hypothetical protein
MLIALVVVLGASPVKVASTDWSFSGLEQTVAEALEGRFLNQLADEGLRVTSSKDVRALLGMERQKQLLGCTEGSCTAELAGALGVDAILTASVVKVGNSFTANLRVSSASNALPLSTQTTRVPTLDALQDWLDAAAKKMAEQIKGGAPEPVTVETSSGAGPGVIRWVPAIAGGALAIGGLAVFLLRAGPADELQHATFPNLEAVKSTRSRGETFETAGIAMMATGAAAVAASVLWVALSPSKSVAVSIAPTRNGGVLAVGGTFP